MLLPASSIQSFLWLAFLMTQIPVEIFLVQVWELFHCFYYFLENIINAFKKELSNY